jgi:hypothetical protein
VKREGERGEGREWEDGRGRIGEWEWVGVKMPNFFKLMLSFILNMIDIPALHPRNWSLITLGTTILSVSYYYIVFIVFVEESYLILLRSRWLFYNGLLLLALGGSFRPN